MSEQDAYQRGWDMRAVDDRARCPYRERALCEAWEAGYQDWSRVRLGDRALHRAQPWYGHPHDIAAQMARAPEVGR